MPPSLAHRLDGLVGVTLLSIRNSAEVPGWTMSRTSSLELLSMLVLATCPSGGLAGADGGPEDRDEEQRAENRDPQNMAQVAPGADRVMAGADVVAAVFVARSRDRVWLDNQVRQPPCLVGGGRDRLIRVSDSDQVSHDIPFLVRCSSYRCVLSQPAGGVGHVLILVPVPGWFFTLPGVNSAGSAGLLLPGRVRWLRGG
jgi:hypothetical protein